MSNAIRIGPEGLAAFLAASRPQRLLRAGVVTGRGAAALVGGSTLVLGLADAAALFGWYFYYGMTTQGRAYR